MNLSSTQLRLLGRVMYFAAVALMINYFAQFAIQIWPFKFGELNWRVGSAGIFMDVLLATVIPQALLYTAGILNNDRKLLQVMRWITLAVGLLTFVLLGLFALDAVQIWPQLPQGLKGNFRKVAMKASLIGVMMSTLFTWFGLTMGKVLKSQGTVRTPGVRDTAQENMLMVSSREPAPSRPNLRAIDGNEAKRDAKKDGTGGLSIDA